MSGVYIFFDPQGLLCLSKGSIRARKISLHHEDVFFWEAKASAHRRLERVDEAKTLLRKTIPVVRRTLGENHDLTLSMRSMYAKMLFEDPTATLDGLRKATTTLKETERTARRVLGGAHPLTSVIENNLILARAALHARETQCS